MGMSIMCLLACLGAGVAIVVKSKCCKCSECIIKSKKNNSDINISNSSNSNGGDV